MKQLFLLLFFLILSNVCFSQIGGFSGADQTRNQTRNLDSTFNKEVSVTLSGKTKYTDYKIISFKNDTTYVDTTLTLQKEYKYNFRRKDNFELLEFHNQGQTFTSLAYDYSDMAFFPDIGFRGKQFSYMNIEDINYYQVATPTTEILYRTGLEQGQVLDALFTLNFSKRLNLSFAYKGLRSLGQYRRSLASTGNFRGTLSYRTPKDQYAIRMHVTSQDSFNEENGGLPEEMLIAFETNAENFRDRGVIDVNLDDSENLFEGTRVYVDHTYKLFSSKKDSTNLKNFSNLKVGHVFTYESKIYNFTQSAITSDVFGDAFSSNPTKEETQSTLVNNQGYLEFNSKYILGKFKVKANYTDVSYGYDSVYNPTVNISRIKLAGTGVSLGADWKGKIGNLSLNAAANVAPGSGYLAGNYFKGEAIYQKDSLFTVKGSLLQSSKAPNFNFQLFHSNYDAYNWNKNFENIATRNLGFSFLSKWGNASANFTNIEDYTYFDQSSKPQQHDGSITYLKVKAHKEFKLGKFALDNTVMYQNVSSGSEVFRVPEFTTRNTLYYADDWFKGNPLYVQIGATFKYFTKYSANAYNPLLAEFTLQDETEIGYPNVDVFFNARVRRTRIYFKVDNIMSNFTSTKDYYSAPNYPYRDFVIRFGLVWNWFI